MIGIAEIRRYAMALPEVNEAQHFRLPAFKVRDKVFVVIQKGNTHALVSLDEQQADAAATQVPDAYEVVRRNNGRIFVGVRVDLARGSKARIKELVHQAWRHKAPRSLSAASKVK